MYYTWAAEPSARSPILKNKVLIIVPTYNEKENLENTYSEIFKHTRKCDLLIIDDASPDGTGEIADRLARKDKRVKVLHRTGKKGLGSAYIDGLQYALAKGYDSAITMDADLSHQPSIVPRMLSLLPKYDLIIGSRYVQGGGMVNWGVKRLLLSTIANITARKAIKTNIFDCTSGFRCYKSTFLQKIPWNRLIAKGYVFHVEMIAHAHKLGMQIHEIPIIFINRHVGKSKMDFREILHFAWVLFQLRFLRF